MKKNVNRRFDSAVDKNALKTTKLRLESLESRELLSVAPGAELVAPDARAACESSLATPDDEVLDLAAALLDGANAATEGATSIVVTSAADVVDASDGVVTLREAIEGAQSDGTITFASSLKGKTIALDSELGQLTVDASLTIDASNLWNGATSAPGLTISGQGATRIMYVREDVVIKGITFTNGRASDDGYGGAIYNDGATLSLDNCVISNSCAYYGGGVYSEYGKTTLFNCAATNNSAQYGGGAYFSYSEKATLTNCVLSNNSAQYAGGGLYVENVASLYNCTITDNTASDVGGAFLNSSAVLNAYNTIISGNSATNEDGDDDVRLNSDNSETAVANAFSTLSSFADWTSGTNNLVYNASQPLFTNAATRDYTLANNSQAIDMGSNQYVTTFGDFSGNRRVFNGTVDLGAYESRRAPSSVVSETLTKPASLREAEKTGTTISIAWDAVPNASGYKIAWRNKNDSSNSYVTLPVSATSYTLTGLDYGASYYWKVQALGDGVYYADSAYTSARTVTTLAANTPVTVTTEADVVDNSDGLISLREAIEYAGSGETIKFASSLKGKTIALDPELGELTVNRSLTIDATNLWNTTTSSPGLTINGQRAFEILEIHGSSSDGESVAVEINGITFTNSGWEAIYKVDATLTLVNCALVDNADSAMYSVRGETTLINCLVAGNSESGLDIYDGTTNLYNCTITDNTDYYGDGRNVYLAGSNAVFNAYNSIIAGNDASDYGVDVYCWHPNVVVNAYNTLSSFANWTNGENNLTYDSSKPLFTDAATGDYTLAPNSQAIDKGEGQYVSTSVDLAGNPRVSGETVDLGAYEYQFVLETPSTVVTTELDVVDAYDGLISLREAIDYAESGATIAFDSSLKEKTIALDPEFGQLTVNKSLTINASNLYDNNTQTPGITISGQGESRILYVEEDEDAEDQHQDVVVEINGIKFTNGCSEYSDDDPFNDDPFAGYGGAIFNNGATLSLSSCMISDNTASFGGGVFSNNGETTLTDCAVANNTVVAFEYNDFTIDGFGGAICNSGGALSLASCDIYDNEAGMGGGVYSDGETTLANCALTNNTASKYGGAVIISNGSLLLDSCTLTDNTASRGGGVYSDEGGETTLVNCTLANNTALYDGGAIYQTGYQTDATLSLRDCIIRDNEAEEGGGVYSYYGGIITLANCILTNNTASDHGGAIENFYTTLSLSDCLISYNEADYGGGIRSYNPDDYETTLVNCTLTNNTASNYGGGLYSSGATTFVNCTLTNNTASNYGGGLFSSGTTTFDNCTLTNNTASKHGGGLYSSGATTFDNCTLTNNTASNYGGAIYHSGATLSLRECIVCGNEAKHGGGLYSSGATTFANCILTNNTASQYSAIYSTSATLSLRDCLISYNKCNNSSYSSIHNEGGALSLDNCVICDNTGAGVGSIHGVTSLVNCTLTNNTSSGFGGAIYVDGYITNAKGDATLSLNNCEISGNYAEQGGGVRLSACDATLVNCTVTNNTAKYSSGSDSYGGGLVFASASYGNVLNVYNSIIVGNSGKTGYSDCSISRGAVANAYNTLSSYSSWTNGGNNITYDATKPLFMNASAGNYTLAENSQAINKGNKQYVATSVDLAGNPRISGGTVDLGAYERRSTKETPSTVVTTELDVVNAYDGLISLREALRYADSGATITFSNLLQGKTIKLDSQSGELTARQSITIDASNLRDATTSAPGLTISGRGLSRILNVYQSATSPVDVEINGIKLTNGCATLGGAIFNYGASLSLNDCIICDNEAEVGGGVNSCGGETTLTNCTITDNTAENFGGAVYCSNGATTLVNCSVINNTANDGGAIYNDEGTLSLSDCTIRDNEAFLGGGMTSIVGVTTLANCTLTNNASEESGGFACLSIGSVFTATNCLVAGNNGRFGGAFELHGTATLYNCTIADNRASGCGGGFCLDGNAVLTAYNTIIAENSASSSGDDVYLESSDFPVANAYNTLSSFSNWTGGADNLTYDASQPLFTDVAAGDYTLAENSQAINKGNNRRVTTFTDIAGNIRVFGGAVDLGAYESQFVPDSVVSETLTKPTNPREAEKTGTMISIVWDAVPNASGYRLAWRNKNDSADSYFTFDASTTSYTLTGLDYAATYFWKVQALGDGGYYADSAYTTARSVATASSNTPLTVTTEDDVYDFFDGQISLREALEYAKPGDTIAFADSLCGKTIALELAQLEIGKSITIDASSLWHADSQTPGMTISGQDETRLLYIDGLADVIINGITFTNGYMDSEIGISGGAIYSENATLSLNNCMFVDNYANYQGGAIYSENATLLLKNCAISDNSAERGGGVFSYQGETTLVNCAVTNNTAEYYGGGVLSFGGETTLVNCLVAGNSSSDSGGLEFYNENATLFNCTIVDNTSSYYHGGGVQLVGDAILNAYNTIIANNRAWSGGDDVYLNNPESVANAYDTLSSFTEWTSGANNVVYDASQPLFTDVAAGDYTLASNSQALDMGDNQYVTTSVDLAGNLRIAGWTVDLGAYEVPQVVQLATPAPTVTAKSATSITASWDAVPGASGYRFIWKEQTAPSYTYVTLDASKTSYKFSGLDNDASYVWKVLAIGDGAYYLNSDYCATRRDKPQQTLAAPTTTVVSAPVSLTLNWDAVTGAERYTVSYKLASESSWHNVNVGKNLSYTIAKLQPDSQYELRFRTVGDGLNYKTSDYSATVAAKTDPAPDPIKLDAPTPAVVAKTATTITASWDVVPNASGYRFIWKNQSDSSYTTVTLDASATSYKMTGLDVSATYIWKVLAIGDGLFYLNSDYCATQRDKPRQTLATPTLIATAATTSATLTWNPVPNAVGYSVSYKLANSSTWSSDVDVGANLSATITGLEQNSQYDVRLKAVGDGVDYGTSAYSTTVQVQTREPETLDVPTPSVTAKTSTTITAAWDAVPNASGYQFIWKNQSDSSYTYVTLSAAKTSYKMTGLDTGATYVWKVQALGDAVSYLKSAYCATQRDKPQQTLATPTVTATASTTSATLSWDAVPNAERYGISYRPSTSTTWSSDLDAGTNLSYTLTGLARNTLYYVRVRAIGDGVDYKTSAYTATLRVKTVEPVQLAVPTPSVTAKTATTITAAWDAVPNASGYQFIWKNQSDSSYTYVTLSAAKTSYKMTGLDTGATYVWKVQALGDNVSYLKSAYCVTQRDKPQQTLAAPNAPAADPAATIVTVSWSAVPNAERYGVSYRPSTESTWSSDVDAGANLSYTITGLEKNTLYYVRVRAIGDGIDYKTSAYSSTLRAKTNADAIQLATPSVTVVVSSNILTVAWDAVPNATRYGVSYKPSSATTWTNVNAGANLSYTISGLEPDAQYDVRVKAVGDEVNYKSATSSIARAQTTSASSAVLDFADELFDEFDELDEEDYDLLASNFIA